jgi:GAF domain-containing protein
MMLHSNVIRESDKTEFYRELCAQLRALLGEERDPIANAANTSALLFQAMPRLNWAGFYFLRDRDLLILGPFQGKPACVRIAVGRGVCGTAAQQQRSVIVKDVNAFPGHIACDEASRSELVVPLVGRHGVLGVLDLDSPIEARFDDADRMGIEEIASIYVAGSDLPE